MYMTYHATIKVNDQTMYSTGTVPVELYEDRMLTLQFIIDGLAHTLAQSLNPTEEDIGFAGEPAQIRRWALTINDQILSYQESIALIEGGPEDLIRQHACSQMAKEAIKRIEPRIDWTGPHPYPDYHGTATDDSYTPEFGPSIKLGA